MYGPLLSVLLMGMVPAWGESTQVTPLTFSVTPPVLAQLHLFETNDPTLTASGAIVVDLDSAQVVYERSADTQRPMASLTKLMTALIIAEKHDLNETVVIPAHVTDVIGNVAYLPPGETFTVGDLLSALLIMSANDAAVVLAEYHSGSVEEFAAAMNRRAQELGLKDTSYQNPAGLDAPTQLSTPRDLAWLAMYVMRNPAIAKRMSTPSAVIQSFSGKTISLIHTHQLLSADDSQVFAGKTGTTDGAGQCLLSIAESNGRRYIAVLLHSSERYTDMRRVLDMLNE